MHRRSPDAQQFLLHTVGHSIDHAASPLDETFDVGIDSRTSMNDSACQVSLPFNGKIDKLSVKLGPIQLTEEDQVKLRRAVAMAHD